MGKNMFNNKSIQKIFNSKENLEYFKLLTLFLIIGLITFFIYKQIRTEKFYSSTIDIYNQLNQKKWIINFDNSGTYELKNFELSSSLVYEGYYYGTVQVMDDYTEKKFKWTKREFIIMDQLRLTYQPPFLPLYSLIIREMEGDMDKLYLNLDFSFDGDNIEIKDAKFYNNNSRVNIRNWSSEFIKNDEVDENEDSVEENDEVDENEDSVEEEEEEEVEVEVEEEEEEENEDSEEEEEDLFPMNSNIVMTSYTTTAPLLTYIFNESIALVPNTTTLPIFNESILKDYLDERINYYWIQIGNDNNPQNKYPREYDGSIRQKDKIIKKYNKLKNRDPNSKWTFKTFLERKIKQYQKFLDNIQRKKMETGKERTIKKMKWNVLLNTVNNLYTYF